MRLGAWPAARGWPVLALVLLVMPGLPRAGSPAAAASASPASTAPRPAATGAGCALRVEVHGVRVAQGQVRIALFDHPDRFLRQALRSAVVEAVVPQVSACFDALVAGDYAAVAYHDVNGNRRNDRNLLGIPSEPGAFSNGATAILGPPSWDRAKLRLMPPAVLRMEFP